MRVDATIGVAYYPLMAPMPQWELPHTKVEQAQRTVGNKLLNPSALPANIKGFRAYFQLKGETASLARAFSIDFGNGETTGIISIEHGTLNIDHSVYDLQGRRVSGTTQKGAYIQNGKKVVIK